MIVFTSIGIAVTGVFTASLLAWLLIPDTKNHFWSSYATGEEGKSWVWPWLTIKWQQKGHVPHSVSVYFFFDSFVEVRPRRPSVTIEVFRLGAAILGRLPLGVENSRVCRRSKGPFHLLTWKKEGE